MGRRRKFHIDEVVTWGEHMYPGYDGIHAVVVDYRVKGAQSEYQVVKLEYATGPAYGRPIWVEAHYLDYLENRTHWRYVKRPNIRRVVNANAKMGTSTERGCRCQCCPHTAVPRSVVAQEERDNRDGESV